MKQFLLFCILLIGWQAGAQTLSRKALLVKGQEFERSADVSVEMQMTLFGKTDKMFNKGINVMTISVEQVRDTSYLLNIRTIRKTKKTESSNKSIDFDSDKPADTANKEQWNDFIKAIGDTGRLEITRKGFVISGDDTSIINDTDPLNMLNMNIEGQKNRTKTYPLIADLPARTIKVGDTWSDSTVTQNGRDVIHSTLTSLTPDEGLITYNKTTIAETEMGDGGEKIFIKIKGTATGTATFDPRTGVVRKMEDVINCSGTFKMKGFEIPITMKAINSVTIKTRRP